MNKYNENNQRHGPWESYYDDGQLNYRGEYLNGKKHGIWESYWSNGELFYRGEYINGIRIGFWIIHDNTEFYL